LVKLLRHSVIHQPCGGRMSNEDMLDDIDAAAGSLRAEREPSVNRYGEHLHIEYTGLTGFDVSNAVRVCDPSFSDS
jgi:hypothetical protein